MKKWQYLFGCLAVVSVCVVGCGRNAENGANSGTGGDDHEMTHKEHPAPESLPDAVAKIKETWSELSEGYAAGDKIAAHHAFDEMMSAVNATPALIESAGLERYDSQDAGDAVSRLSNLVGELHPPHSADAELDTATYDRVKPDVEDAINKLEGVVNKGTTQEAPAE